MNRAQRRRDAREKLDRASVLSETASKQSASPQAILAACHRLFEMGRMRDALPALRQACVRFPAEVPLRVALAYALATTGDGPAAIDEYRILLKREPNTAPLLTNLAVLLVGEGGDEILSEICSTSRLPGPRPCLAQPDHSPRFQISRPLVTTATLRRRSRSQSRVQQLNPVNSSIPAEGSGTEVGDETSVTDTSSRPQKSGPSKKVKLTSVIEEVATTPEKSYFVKQATAVPESRSPEQESP